MKEGGDAKVKSGGEGGCSTGGLHIHCLIFILGLMVHFVFVLLVTNSSVVQRDAHDASMMSIVLPNDALAVQLPQPRIVVGACSHQVSRIGREGTVPDPALVSV